MEYNPEHSLHNDHHKYAIFIYLCVWEYLWLVQHPCPFYWLFLWRFFIQCKRELSILWWLVVHRNEKIMHFNDNLLHTVCYVDDQNWRQDKRNKCKFIAIVQYLNISWFECMAYFDIHTMVSEIFVQFSRMRCSPTEHFQLIIGAMATAGTEGWSFILKHFLDVCVHSTHSLKLKLYDGGRSAVHHIN